MMMLPLLLLAAVTIPGDQWLVGAWPRWSSNGPTERALPSIAAPNFSASARPAVSHNGARRSPTE